MKYELYARYQHFYEIAKTLNKEKEFELYFHEERKQGLCKREAIEIAAWKLNLPGAPW